MWGRGYRYIIVFPKVTVMVKDDSRKLHVAVGNGYLRISEIEWDFSNVIGEGG